MTIEITILIIMTSAGLITSLLGPIVSAGIEFSRRIEKSTCLGGNIKLKKFDEVKNEIEKTKQELLETNSMNEQKIRELLENIKRENK